jgi:hypothetical protein
MEVSVAPDTEALTYPPETDSEGLVPNPLPVIVTFVAVPASQVLGLMLLTTGVASPTLKAAALLVPKRVDNVILSFPVVALVEML